MACTGRTPAESAGSDAVYPQILKATKTQMAAYRKAQGAAGAAAK